MCGTIVLTESLGAYNFIKEIIISTQANSFTCDCIILQINCHFKNQYLSKCTNHYLKKAMLKYKLFNI